MYGSTLTQLFFDMEKFFKDKIHSQALKAIWKLKSIESRGLWT